MVSPRRFWRASALEYLEKVWRVRCFFTSTNTLSVCWKGFIFSGTEMHRDAQRCTESLKATPFQLFQLFQLFYQLSQTLSILMAMDGLGRAFQRLPTLKHPRRGTCEALWALFTCLPCSNFAQYFDVFCSMTWTQQSSLCSWIKITPAAWVCRSLQTCRFLFCWANEGFRFEWRLLLISLDYVMLPEPLVENSGIWNNDLADNWQITRSMGQSCALCCLVDAWYNGHDRKVKLRLEASFELSSRTGDGPTPSRQNAGNVNISTDPNCRFMSILLFWCSQGYKAFGWLSRASLMYLFA